MVRNLVFWWFACVSSHWLKQQLTWLYRFRSPLPLLICLLISPQNKYFLVYLCTHTLFCRCGWYFSLGIWTNVAQLRGLCQVPPLNSKMSNSRNTHQDGRIHEEVISYMQNAPKAVFQRVFYRAADAAGFSIMFNKEEYTQEYTGRTSKIRHVFLP